MTFVWAALVAPPSLGAQPRGTLRDIGDVVEALGRGIYAIIHDDAIHDWPSGVTDWPHGNTGVIVGSRCVLVVDATYYPSRAAADIALIRRITTRPVCYLVNTHWHGDHTHGNGVYRQTFPRIRILGTAQTRDFIALNQARYPARVIAPGSPARGALDQLLRLKSTGVDSAGAPITGEAASRLEHAIAERSRQLSEFAQIRVEPPDSVFRGTARVDLGGVVVTIRSRGRANSPDDLTVAAGSDVSFVGDIVVSPVPFAFESHPTHWVHVLDDIAREHPRIVVPGHGPVMRDLAYLRRERLLLDTVIARVRVQATAGKDAKDMQAIDLSDLRPLFVVPGEPNAAAWWDDSIVGALLDRTYWCVVGYRC